jgi:hypothetical protein
LPDLRAIRLEDRLDLALLALGLLRVLLIRLGSGRRLHRFLRSLGHPFDALVLSMRGRWQTRVLLAAVG